MRIVGIDPSLTATGLAYMDLDSKEVLDWKCVRTKPMKDETKTEDFARRLFDISVEVRRYCVEHPGAVAIEAQAGWGGGAASMANVFKLGCGYGAVLASIPTRPFPIAPQMVKHRLGVASGLDKTVVKDAAWDAAKRFFCKFPMEPSNKPSREAVRDAVCVAVAALPELDRHKAMFPGAT